MKLEVGMYARTKKYGIHKISEIDERKTVYKYICDYRPHEDGDGTYTYSIYADKDIVKASHNIIDLIQEGDYVNGFRVEGVYNPTGNEVLWIKLSCNPIDNWENEDIKSIVTKEQFEAMAYKVV